MKELSKFKKNCRLCNSNNLKKIINIPKSQPVDNFRRVFHHDLDLPSFTMDLYMCLDCNHAQLLNVVSPDILYGNYVYLSNSSTDLKKHFKEYSEFLFKKKYIKKNQSILDIGCNDGLLLDFFKNKKVRTYGIDPAPKAIDICSKNGHITFSDYFNNHTAKKILLKSKKKFNIITANNVFSHSHNLLGILKNAKSLLLDNGYYIFEVSYLADTIKNRVIDYIYHEHLSYHSIKSLVPFLRKAGMYIYNVKKVSTKGGSIRVVSGCKKENENKKLISKLIKEEENLNIYNLNFYRKINKEINNTKSLINNYLSDLKNKNPNINIFAYGASATGIVLSRMLGIDRYLSAYIDDNKAKVNLLSPNSFLPVISLEHIKNKKNILILILAWRFAKSIKNIIKNKLPKNIRVITLKPVINNFREIK